MHITIIGIIVHIQRFNIAYNTIFENNILQIYKKRIIIKPCIYYNLIIYFYFINIYIEN